MTPAFIYAATVERVVDADTIDVDLDLGMRIHHRVRLRVAHIDAPERWTEAGRAAVVFAAELLPVGAVVTVATRRPDKYGRALADVALPDGRDLGQVLIAAGHAAPYEGGAR